jgi:hypothetical protein
LDVLAANSPATGEGSVRAVTVPPLIQLHPRRNFSVPLAPGASVKGTEKTSLRTVPSERVAVKPMRNEPEARSPVFANWTTTLSCAASLVVSIVIEVMAISADGSGCG